MAALERSERSPLEVGAVRELSALGQSVWLDSLARRMLYSGALEALMQGDGVTGASLDVPAFERGGTMPISTTDTRDAQIRLVDDARAAADLLRPIHESTGGRDGFVSVPLSTAARDTSALVAEARTLWTRVERQNVLVRIPATNPGVAAIRTLTEAGINVHATLVFGRFRYAHVANAYITGLRSRAARGLALDRVASVASMCLSPIDALVDPQLETMAGLGSEKAVELLGKAAIAEARRTYARYRDLFHGENGSSSCGELGELVGQGARPQRLMWTKMGLKCLKYVEALVEPDTIVELSLDMVEAYRKLGHPDLRPARSIADAALTAAKLAALGLGSRDIEMLLETEEIEHGVASSEKSFAALNPEFARSIPTADRMLG